MVYLLDIPELGKLELVEVYEYYDQPVLYSCKNASGQLYLVVAAAEDEKKMTWLCTAVSDNRLNQIRSGFIDLHDAFAESENSYTIQVKVPYEQNTSIMTDYIQSKQLPEEMLPLSGECLNLKSEGPPSAFIVTGILIGAVLRSKTFEIETLEKTYIGTITDEAFNTVRNATLSKEYTAELQEITQRSKITNEIVNPKYVLLSLK